MNILQEADKLTSGDRQEAYGSPSEAYGKVAQVWSAILNREVTSQQVILCMIALKLCREANKHGRDNVVDIAGYARLIEMIPDKPDALEKMSEEEAESLRSIIKKRVGV